MTTGPPQPPPDPSGDATGDAADTADTLDTASYDPADLPTAPETATGVPAYGPDFGREAQPEQSWVPQRSSTRPPDPVTPQGASPSRPSLRTVTLGGTAGRLLGGRLQGWHVVAAAIGVLIPVGVAVVSSLASDFEPPDRPVVSITRQRLLTPTPFTYPTIVPPSITAPGLPTGPGATITIPNAPRPTRSVMTAPPPVVTVPAIPVTPVPTDARTIRFEAYAEAGTRIEVSLSDARHQRFDYPVQKAPLAFQTPLDPNVASNDYFSLRVRVHDPTGSGDRTAVSCRIVVDGIVVTSQQGRGYATCYINPYYDIKRP